jgi:molecular chaperone GrpE
MLQTLADVCDRLRRGFDLTRERPDEHASRGSWLARLRARVAPPAAGVEETVDALREAYRLTLARIEETLERHGVVAIEAQGARFDPRCMQAVQMERTAHVAEGTVVAVIRAGYLWEDEVLRTAQVSVARALACEEAQ